MIALGIAYAWDKAGSPVVRIGVILMIPLATFISVGVISGWSWRNASPKVIRETLAREQAVRRARQASVRRCSALPEIDWTSLECPSQQRVDQGVHRGS